MFKRWIFWMAVILTFLVTASLVLREYRKEPVVKHPALYLSALYVKYQNGVSVSYHMFGPAPGPGEMLEPTNEWYVPLKAASANTSPFYYDERPTLVATKAIFRVVWAPRNTDARLMASFIADMKNPHRQSVELVRFSPWNNQGKFSQKIEHCLGYPRAVDVDVTKEFNQALQRNMHVDIFWEVRQHQDDGVAAEPAGIKYNC